MIQELSDLRSKDKQTFDDLEKMSTVSDNVRHNLDGMAELDTTLK